MTSNDDMTDDERLASYYAALREGRIKVDYGPIGPIYVDPGLMPPPQGGNVQQFLPKELASRQGYARQIEAEVLARWHLLFKWFGIDHKHPNGKDDLLGALAAQHVPFLSTTSEPPKPPKPTRSPHRPPELTIDKAFGLVAELDQKIAAIKRDNPKQKTAFHKDALNNLIAPKNHPHSWWWSKDAPLKFPAADKKYRRAVKLLENYEKEHGQAYEPMLLARLGERAGIKPPRQPRRTVEQMIEQMIEETLDHRRWLYKRKDTMSSSGFLASKRDSRRSERLLVDLLKKEAANLGHEIAKDGPKWPAEKLAQDRERLKYLKSQVADFEAKLTKLGGG